MSYAPQSSPPPHRLPACLALLLACVFLVPVPDLEAQAATRLRADTPLHAEAGGLQLGTLRTGTAVTPGRTSGTWREVTVQGWIWNPSIGPSSRQGFDVAVTNDDGENVRATPNGTVVLKAIRGAHFSRVKREGAWTQVRRSGWIPASALPARAPLPDQPTAPAASAPAQETTAAAPAARDTSERVIVRAGTTLASGPGAAEVGTVREAMSGEVTARAGGWVRVRTETWVRAEAVTPAPDSAALTLEALRAEPKRFIGETVSWRLQFIALKVADELRPELPLGEPYVLARGPLPEAGFVYVAVSAEQAERFRAMRPLDEFAANGTLRAARTRFLPTPVLDLRKAP